MGCPSPASREKGLQQGSALSGENARSNFDLVIQRAAREHFETRTNRPAFGIIRAINDPRNARLNDSARTHAARFQRDVECRASHAVISQRLRRFADHDDFGVSRRIAVANGAIPRARENFSFMNDESANGNLSSDGRGARFLNRE